MCEWLLGQVLGDAARFVWGTTILNDMSKFGQVEGEAASSPPPFIAKGWRGNRHFQTIWANRSKRDPAGARLAAGSTPAVIESEDGDLLRLYWSRHGDANGIGGAHEDAAGASAGSVGSTPRPVLVVMHGLTGSADADNVMATAAKGYDLGFEVVRVDLRNTQADDAPSLGVGHAGRSEDLRATLRHVAETEPGAPVAVIGFSMGGNITLKAMGEYGGQPPEILQAVATISVPIDLDDACTAIDERRENWIYRTYFLRRLARRYLNARQQRPDLFHPIDVDSIRGIRDWDNAVVAPLGGYENAEDYYARNSALNVLGSIRVPTLVVHAQDDPFIPFEPFGTPAVRDNDCIRLLAPRQGGHVGFFSTQDIHGEPDRYWGENRAVAFCAEAVGLSWGNGAGRRWTPPDIE
jgi:predicted alpha/beta-fold hydrolase